MGQLRVVQSQLNYNDIQCYQVTIINFTRNYSKTNYNYNYRIIKYNCNCGISKNHGYHTIPCH